MRLYCTICGNFVIDCSEKFRLDCSSCSKLSSDDRTSIFMERTYFPTLWNKHKERLK